VVIRCRPWDQLGSVRRWGGRPTRRGVAIGASLPIWNRL